MAVAKLDGIEIPNVTALRLSPTIIASQERALDGTLHSDVLAGVGVKRGWELQARFLTSAQYNALYTHVFSTKIGQVMALWLDSFGAQSNAVNVQYELGSWSEERVQFAAGDGTWESDGRHVQLRLLEA